MFSADYFDNFSCHNYHIIDNYICQYEMTTFFVIFFSQNPAPDFTVWQPGTLAQKKGHYSYNMLNGLSSSWNAVFIFRICKMSISRL